MPAPPAYRVIDRRRLDRLEPRSPTSHRSPLSDHAYGWNLYETPRSSGDSDSFRPRSYTKADPDYITGYELEEIRGYSRRLVAQVCELNAAIIQKANYAVGDAWKPQFKGQNKPWGQAAEDWLHHVFLPNCDVRGTLFDFATQLWLSSLAYDIDGDDTVIFTDDSDRGLPKLKFVDSCRIGTGYTRSGDKVEGGRFDGATIKDGVICDRDGTMIGIRLLGTEQGKHLDISVAESQLHFEPFWRTPLRGVPRMAVSLLDWCSLQDIDHYLKVQVKLDSSVGLLQYNEGGRADTGRSLIEAREGDDSAINPTTDVRRETLFGGQIWYMRANSGDKLEPYKSDRPHPNVEDFLRRLRRGGLAALGWPFELLDPSAIGGASVRLIQDQARHSLRARKKSIRRRARRCIQYAIGVAMHRGFIPKNDDPDDFLRWDFEEPAELTVDEGYSEQADRENLLLGTTTLASVVQKKGRWWEDVRTQRESENRDLIDRAGALVAHAKAGGHTLTLREALDMMQRDSTLQRNEPEPAKPKPAKT